MREMKKTTTKLNTEAVHFISGAFQPARFPNISRKLSILLINLLYKKGATSVEVHETDAYDEKRYITKLVIRTFDSKVSKTLFDYMARAEPSSLSQDSFKMMQTQDVIIAHWNMNPVEVEED
jgi:hypothetical protein